MRRDGYKCRCCGKKGKDRQGDQVHLNFHEDSNELVTLDAHHIYSREEMPNGGYVKENGISVCDDCHLKAEEFWETGTPVEGYSPDDLYKIINSSYEQALVSSKKLS